MTQTTPIATRSTFPAVRGLGGGRVIYCEKIGPMHWRIHVPGRAAFDYWSYALTHAGQTHTESFVVTAAGPDTARGDDAGSSCAACS